MPEALFSKKQDTKAIEAEKIADNVISNYRKYGAALSEQSKQDAVSRAMEQAKKSGDIKTEVKREIFRELASTSPFVALKIEMDFYRVSLKAKGTLLNLGQMEQMYSITSKHGIIPESKEQGWASYQQGSRELAGFVEKLAPKRKETGVKGEAAIAAKAGQRDLSYIRTATDQEVIKFAQQELERAAEYTTKRNPNFGHLSNNLPLIKVVLSQEIGNSDANYRSPSGAEDKRGAILVNLEQIRKKPQELFGTLVHELNHAQLDSAVRLRGAASAGYLFSGSLNSLDEGRGSLEEYRSSGELVYPVSGSVYAIIEKIPGASEALAKGDVNTLRDRVDSYLGKGIFDKAFGTTNLLSKDKKLELSEAEKQEIGLLKVSRYIKEVQPIDAPAVMPYVVLKNVLMSDEVKYSKVIFALEMDKSSAYAIIDAKESLYGPNTTR